MNKQTLDTVSQLVSFEAIDKAKKGEEFDAYVKRMYPNFEKFVTDSNNPVISEIESDSRNALNNAVSKLSVRMALIANFCAVNDPFELEPPKEATTQDILEFNKVKASEKELKKVMGAEAFDAYIKKLKTPAKDGLTQTEVNQKREEHYAKYAPVMPSEKEYSHNGGGKTRAYHWQKSIQDLYVKDHEAFLSKFGLSDGFPVPEKEEEPAEDSKDKK